MPNPADRAVVDALQQIVAASGPNGDHSHAAREIGSKLAKQKDLKTAFEPLAKQLKNGSGIWIVQSCLELPADHALHAAAVALVANGAVPWPVYLAIADGGPKRVVRNLVLSNHQPIVYAFEDDPRVSLWSMETGEHLRDVKIPAKKGQAVLWHFTDLPDGTLRAMTPRGAVLQCNPGRAEFAVVLELGQGTFAPNGDLSRIVGSTASEVVRKEDGEWLRLAVHSVTDKKKSEFEVPLSRVGSDWLSVGDRYAVFGGMRVADDGREQYSVAVYDFETGETKLYPIGGDVYATEGPREGTAMLTWSETVPKAAILDAATGEITPTARDRESQTGFVFWHGHIRKDGAVIGGYVVDPESNRTSGVFDAKSGRFALASEVPAASVRVVERFDPSRPAAATARAEKPATAPLAWARTGAVLRYSIADFDAEDDWTFEVKDASDGLKLHVVCDGAGAFDVEFSANALASASTFASFSQGSTTEETGNPIDKKLPPFLLSHAMFAKIASGKKLAWKSAWTDKDSLEPQGRGTSRIDVNGAGHIVSVLSASGEEAALEVLDDASWPLLVSRTEGDCHVKLVSVDLSNATGEVANPGGAPAAKPAKPAKPAPSETSPAAAAAASAGVSADVGGWQRFESTEDGASKFWEVSLAGSTMNIRFGKIGTNGQAQTKSFASEDAARAERDKLVREKTKKGYRATSG